jgi:hypothetical protein
LRWRSRRNPNLKSKGHLDLFSGTLWRVQDIPASMQVA